MAVALAVALSVAMGQAQVSRPASAATGGADHGAPGPAPGTGLPTPPMSVSQCPWLAAAIARHESPAALADLVVDRMTLPEELGELVLRSSTPYENVNAGVPRLCIPSLTLQDGPAGLGFHDTGVTSLPAPLAVAATFDPAVAREDGQVEGAEARGQGIDVVQGPNLDLARVPEDGRNYETYGEDPTLAATLGVADIDGIQSAGVMAEAKHLVAYNQETNRRTLDTVVPARALQELYLAPFRAAVVDAHVASIMCAYPRLDGTYQCEDPTLQRTLAQWGFTGFVRSDLGAVHNAPAALSAGTDLLKPASEPKLLADVATGQLARSVVIADVTRMLTQMFAYGMVGRPVSGVPGTPVDTAAHTAFALQAAERSAVLLRDRGGVLPLKQSTDSSVAVIGADASTNPATEGFGSSYVTPPFVSTPLGAIRAAAGQAATVTDSDGGSSTQPLPDVPTADLTPAVGAGHGLTLAVTPAAGRSPMQTVDPVAAASFQIAPSATAPAGSSGRGVPGAGTPTTTPEAGPQAGTGTESQLGEPEDWNTLSPTGTAVTLPRGWQPARAEWSGQLSVPRTGIYSLSLSGSGTTTVTLDGNVVIADSERQGTWSQPVTLRAGQSYALSMLWTPLGGLTDVPVSIHLGMAFDGDAIAHAVAAARAARVAVVFASDYSSEAFDLPSMSLPGDQNALIAAVAAANPRTVVVLNTGGPVAMPWLGTVAAVVEAWYPGEEDGAAIAAVLYGKIDPSGHLPITFPVSETESAIHSASQWPGDGLVSTYSEGLDIGYRYDNATGVRPLFPFGYGLSYTTFAFGGLRATTLAGGAVQLSFTVTDTGGRSGTEVAQAYLTYPAAASEPPGELVAFTPVALAAGATRRVTLTVPASALQVFLASGWTTVAGTYTLAVGDSSASTPLATTITVP